MFTWKYYNIDILQNMNVCIEIILSLLLKNEQEL
jgi:hypothetical protein